MNRPLSVPLLDSFAAYLSAQANDCLEEFAFHVQEDLEWLDRCTENAVKGEEVLGRSGFNKEFLERRDPLAELCNVIYLICACLQAG